MRWPQVRKLRGAYRPSVVQCYAGAPDSLPQGPTPAYANWGRASVAKKRRPACAWRRIGDFWPHVGDMSTKWSYSLWMVIKTALRTWEFSSTFIWNPCMAKALCRTRACKAGKEGNVVFRMKAAQTHACAWATLPTTNGIPRTWAEELDRTLSAPALLIRRIGNQSRGSARTNVTADTLPPTALRVIT